MITVGTLSANSEAVGETSILSLNVLLGEGGGGGGGGGKCPPSDRSVGAIAPTALKPPTPLTSVQCMLLLTASPVTCVKNALISDVEAIGHDHVEETMGYVLTVEGMSTLLEAMRHE